MLLNAQRAQLTLADDEVARLNDAFDSRLEVTQGFVWITIDGDRNDVVLAAGESLLIDTREAVTVSAIRGAASLKVLANAGARPSRPAAAARTRVRPGRFQQLLAGISLSSVAVA
jgi:Protein of unknown function (DUF2917)